MHLAGIDGVAITLTALRWEFPPDAGEWDDAWLIISGHVDEGDEEWSFEDPCLLMGEARELAKWLRDVGEGRIDPDPGQDDEQPEPTLSFLEPALGFSIYGRDENELHIRVFFAALGAPPRLREDDPHYAVSLRVRPDQMLAAADDWSRELDALPARPWVEPS